MDVKGGVKIRLDNNIVITKLTLDGHELPNSPGLSELLNRAEAWEYIHGSADKNRTPSGYQRKVVLEDGKLRTYLFISKGD